MVKIPNNYTVPFTGFLYSVLYFLILFCVYVWTSICPHSFTPLASKTQIPPRCGRDYTKETASVASFRLRGTVMAANRKTRHNNTVTSRQYGRSAIFVLGDVKFQDGDAFDLSKLGGGGGRCLPLLLRSFYVLFALAYFAIRYTHIGLQLHYGTTACATFGYFLCPILVNVRGV